MAANTESLLDFPLGGLDEQRAFVRQRKVPGDGSAYYTTPDALNVRGYEWATDRLRGGSRPGLSRFLEGRINSTRLGVQPHSIQEINELITGELEDLDAPAGVGRAVASLGEDVSLLSAAGAAYFTIEGVAAANFTCSCWGANDDVYVAFQNTEVPRVDIYKAASGGGGAVSWLEATSILNASVVAGMRVVGEYLYVAVTHEEAPAGRIYKLQTSDGSIVGGTFWLSETQISGLTWAANSINCLAAVEHLLGAVASGAFLILDTVSASLSASLANVGTTARAPKADSDGAFFYATCNETTKLLKKIRTDGTLVWSYALTDAENAVCYDAHTGKLFVAQRTTGTVLVINSDTGALYATVNPGSFGGFDDVDADWAGNVYFWRDGESGNDVVSLTQDGSSNYAVTVANTTHTGSSVNRGRRQTRPARRRILVVSGGRLSVVSEPTDDAPDRVATVVTGGQAWSATVPRVFSTQRGLFQYYVDGIGYSRYSAATNEVAAWTASAGSLPVDAAGRACRLIATWRDGIMLSGLEGDPQNWFLSRRGDPRDFEYGSTANDPKQAVAGNNAPAGLVGDVVTCLIPYSDDLFYFGCDHSIWVLAGDPAAGGSLNFVSDSVGMAFGRPYCRTPDGTIFFFAARGGVFTLQPGRKPQRVSQQITHRLNQVDVRHSCISMAWDDRAQGVHLFITDESGPAAGQQHYFFDLRAGAWWPVEHADPDFDPKCCYALDGDEPGDRVVLIGSWDSRIRGIDTETGRDDGLPFESYVTLGPFLTQGLGELMLHELQPTLSEDAAAVECGVLVGRSAAGALTSQYRKAVTFAAGRNRTHEIRRSGAAIYVRMTSAGLWAMEQMRAKLSDLGPVRRRNR